LFALSVPETLIVRDRQIGRQTDMAKVGRENISQIFISNGLATLFHNSFNQRDYINSSWMEKYFFEVRLEMCTL
jgi:hypothetical protein